MLTPDQLQNYFDSLGLTDEARKTISLIRAAEPSRWIACKEEEKLQQLADQDKSHFVKNLDGTWRIPPGECHAGPLGLRFVIRSSKENDWIVLRSSLLLHDYLRPNRIAVKPSEVNATQEKVRLQARWILRDFIHADPAIPPDTGFQLNTEGTTYVDLRCELLAEPEVTHVFYDRSAAKVHQSYLRAMTSGGHFPPASVFVEKGLRLRVDQYKTRDRQDSRSIN